MNKYEAENYLLDKYKSLIYEYSSLYAKELENRCVGRINIAIAALKAFKNRMSIFTFGFIFNWLGYFVIILIYNIVRSPYDAFKFANKMESLAEGFKDYYFILKHYKELRAFYNQFVSFKDDFNKEKEKEEDLDVS